MKIPSGLLAQGLPCKIFLSQNRKHQYIPKGLKAEHLISMHPPQGYNGGAKKVIPMPNWDHCRKSLKRQRINRYIGLAMLGGLVHINNSSSLRILSTVDRRQCYDNSHLPERYLYEYP